MQFDMRVSYVHLCQIARFTAISLGSDCDTVPTTRSIAAQPLRRSVEFGCETSADKAMGLGSCATVMTCSLCREGSGGLLVS